MERSEAVGRGAGAALAAVPLGVARRRRTVWARLRRDHLAVAALATFVGLLLAAALAPVLAPYDPNAQDLYASFQAPSREHPLGTDDLGRDLLSRLLYGGRVSLTAGLTAMALALVLGVPMGAIAGYFGGRWDSAVMRAMDSLLAFPSIILAIAL